MAGNSQEDSTGNLDKTKPAHDWAASAFEGRETFFSFTYGGELSAELLKTWKREQSSRKLDDNRVRHTLICTDPKTQLEVRCEGVSYPADGAIEWTVFFTNRGSQDSNIIEAIEAIDFAFDTEPTWEGFRALRHFLGSQYSYNDFQPGISQVRTGQRALTFQSNGGKSSNGTSPYFNLEAAVRTADKSARRGGVIVAVGWPGQWQARFSEEAGGKVRVQAGQEQTRFRLHPDETARTPLIALLGYEGDWIDGQNAWRRWMFAYNVPKSQGKLIPPVNVPSSSSYTSLMNGATVENQIESIDAYRNAGITIDYWWMDAGWYPMCDGKWQSTGTWEVDRKRFPKGLRPISDYAHAKGVKTILWFEPERVRSGSWLFENRPEWLLKTSPKSLRGLLNLGLPEAREWTANTIDRIMTEEGIDLYRQDFNTSPLGYWSANDEPDRKGLTENHYVQGYLWFLDELRRRRPGLIIDLCASGGMRHDLESLRRGIAFTQSDYTTAEGDLNQNYTLPFLMPYHGHSVPRTDAYGFWCHATPGLHPRWDITKTDQMDQNIARRIQIWRETVAPCYWGDYYPLTPYSASPDTWLAWQYNHPSEKRSVMQVFRRSTCLTRQHLIHLRALDRNVTYDVSVLDGAGLGDKPRKMSGADLMDKGLDITIPSSEGVSILSIKADQLSAAGRIEPSVDVELVADKQSPPDFMDNPVAGIARERLFWRGRLPDVVHHRDKRPLRSPDEG